MIRQFFNGAVIMAAMLASAAHGQPMPTIVQVPGPNEELQAVAADFSTAEGTQPLLAAIARWLAANFDLPLTLEPPRIVFDSPSAIAALAFKAPLSDQFSHAGTSGSDSTQARQDDIVAVYDGADSTIHLSRGWSGRTPAELSILVHEMVHYIQHVSRISHACREAREKIAYDAQNRWLQLFGRDLADEFGIDPFTRLVNTTCPQ